MNEFTARVLGKIADAGPGWGLVGVFIYRLPWIIGAMLGSTGLSSVLKHFS